MNNAWAPLSAQKTPRTLKWWSAIAAIVILLILLLVFVPILVFVLSIVSFILGLFALVIGRVRWARITNRKSAAGVISGSFIIFIVSIVVVGLNLPAETSTVQPFADTSAANSTAEPSLASFVDETCDADHLVMTQGTENNYCDKNDSGSLVWVTQTAHDQAVAEAEDQAEKKVAEEAKAKAKKVAEAKAKASEDEAAQKAAAEAAKKSAAKKTAAEAEALAEQEAQIETLVEDTPGSSAYYANCSAVKAAGAAPIYSGDPGYSGKLDRDGDGVACES